jgi:hypothetical protein
MTQDASWSSRSEHRAWLASHSGRSVPNSDEERQADLVARIFRSTCAMYPSNLQWATDTAEVIIPTCVTDAYGGARTGVWRHPVF